MEVDPTQKTGVYFAFPNLVVKDNTISHVMEFWSDYVMDI